LEILPEILNHFNIFSFGVNMNRFLFEGSSGTVLFTGKYFPFKAQKSRKEEENF